MVVEPVDEAVRAAHLPGVEHNEAYFVPEPRRNAERFALRRKKSRGLLRSAHENAVVAYAHIEKGRAVTALSARAQGGSAALTTAPAMRGPTLF